MKLIRGIGIKDIDYPITKSIKTGDNKWKQIWRCPYFSRWDKLMERLGPNNPHKTYDDKSCCPDWLYLSKFKAWMETQEWEGLDLDKDILFPGNKIYSPNTCAFVPPWLNTLILTNSQRKGVYPIGVTYVKETGKFRSQVSNFSTNTNLHLGVFSSEQQAHSAWQLGKCEQIEKALDCYKKEKCFRQDINEALLLRIVKLKDENSKSIETTFL